MLAEDIHRLLRQVLFFSVKDGGDHLVLDGRKAKHIS